MRVPDRRPHVLSRLQVVGRCIRAVHAKPLRQQLQTERLESGEPRVVHQLGEVHQFTVVLSDRQEALDGPLYEQLVWLGLLRASEDLDELLRHLEVGRLEPHVLTWRVVEEEPEVDVDEPAFAVDQDVAIVAVLDLEDVADDRVGRLRPDEVGSCLLELEAELRAVRLDEVVIEVDFERLSDLVAAARVGNDLDDAADFIVASSPVADALVGRDKQVQIGPFEDFLEELDELNRQYVLSQVIAGLENAADLLRRFGWVSGRAGGVRDVADSLAQLRLVLTEGLLQLGEYIRPLHHRRLVLRHVVTDLVQVAAQPALAEHFHDRGHVGVVGLVDCRGLPRAGVLACETPSERVADILRHGEASETLMQGRQVRRPPHAA